MTTMSDKDVVIEEQQFIDHITLVNFRVMKYVDSADNELIDLFIAVRASVIGNFFSEIKRNIGASQFRIIFVHEDIPKEWLLEQLSGAGLRVSKVLDKLLVFSDWTVTDRVIKAWADDSQHVLIATALVSKDNLVVRNCALEELKVPFTSPVLCKIPNEERSKFEIDCVGSFISWPDFDIDLDFDNPDDSSYLRVSSSISTRRK